MKFTLLPLAAAAAAFPLADFKYFPFLNTSSEFENEKAVGTYGNAALLNASHYNSTYGNSSFVNGTVVLNSELEQTELDAKNVGGIRDINGVRDIEGEGDDLTTFLDETTTIYESETASVTIHLTSYIYVTQTEAPTATAVPGNFSFSAFQV